MRSVLPRLLPFLPAALLLLFTEWSGTLWYGAQAVPVTVGWLAVGALCLLARERANDPLGLGGRARWGVPALAVAAIASLAFSPVARAGMTGVLVLPLLLFLPAACAACWRGERERAVGALAVVVVIGLVAMHAVIAHLSMGTERAALPLGQHNLLAVWLVLLLPLALIPALRSGWSRGIALFAAVAGVVALGLSGSLAGVVGLVAEVVVLAFALRRLVGRERPGSTRLLMATAVFAVIAGLVAMAPRLLDVVKGQDASLLARLGYAGAALDGFLARPLLGWGPGASSWLLAEHLRPVPGVHPPYEVVSDAHSLWLDALFELGLLGLGALAVVVVLFVLRRVGELRGLGDGPEAARRWASLAAVVGGAVCLLGAGSFDVSALAVAASISMGFGLAAAEVPVREWESAGSRAGSRWLAWVVLLCLLALAPSRIAHWHFDRFLALGGAVGSESSSTAPASPARGETVEASFVPAAAGASADLAVARAEAALGHLQRAARFDPAFPLYRFRLALEAGDERAVAQLRAAAVGARGVGVFWLVAGARAGQGAVPGYREELERACDLDPLGSLAPFVLAVLAPSDEASPERLARAVLSEPRLAASPRLDELEPLLDEALARLERLEGVDAGWRAAVVEQAHAAAGIELKEGAEAIDLTLQVDSLGSTSLSLYGFRRRPARLPVLSVQVARERADRITAPGALTLRETSPEVLAPGCRLASTP